MKKLFILLWTVVLGSSFFGNSFVEYDSRYLEKADPFSNTIIIKFLTVQERGILFSAKGKDCHLEIGVSLGRPYILLKLPGTEEVSLSSTLVITSTPEFHVLRIQRQNNEISLTIDNDLPVKTTIDAEDTRLDFTKGVKIGMAISKTLNTISGFRGCIKSLNFNEYSLISPKSIPRSTRQQNVLKGCSSVLKNLKKETFSFSRQKGGYASFLVAKDGIGLKTINLQFKFKSESVSGNLVRIPTSMNDGFLTIDYEDEYVSLYLTIEDVVKWKVSVSCMDKKSPQDGWHLVSDGPSRLESQHRLQFSKEPQSRSVSRQDGKRAELRDDRTCHDTSPQNRILQTGKGLSLLQRACDQRKSNDVRRRKNLIRDETWLRNRREPASKLRARQKDNQAYKR